jgi:hypothetical protein
MKLEFIPMNQEGTKNMLRIDGAKILGGSFRNFAGRGDKFNAPGKRNFAIRIEDEEIKDALINDVNEFGEGWNVKIKPAGEDEDVPFMFLKVQIKFNGRGPAIYLKSGDAINRMDEDDIDQLDNIDIDFADLDIRPYDGETATGPFRSAYLQSMCIHQAMPRDRFAARYAAASDDEQLPF